MATRKSVKNKSKTLHLTTAYKTFLSDLKTEIHTSQMKAMTHVTKELTLLYMYIGTEIQKRFKKEGWGANVIDKLAKDLKIAFPEIRGFSPRNLRYMRKFAQIWSKSSFLQPMVAKLPWTHNLIIMEKISSEKERLWYIEEALKHNWSKNILSMQIESDLCNRQGKASSNFEHTLPTPDSDLARNMLKDPYNFDFLTAHDEANEREIEMDLIKHIRAFLLELGVGFAFVGNQVHLDIGEQDFYIDLLFYHLELRCFVVIELKNQEFKPEFAGKLNFYLSAVDDRLKHKYDKPTVGIILCKTKNKIVAEYALKNINRPIGVSTYQFTKALPKDLKGSIPSIKEIETELSKRQKPKMPSN